MPLRSRSLRWPPHLATASMALTALVLVGFALWCIWLVMEVSVLRDDVTTRVEWLQRLHVMQTHVQTHSATTVDPDLHALVQEIEHDPRVGVELRQTAVRRELAPLPWIARLVPRIRAETATLSTELGRHWTALNGLAAGALLLAASTLGLLIYVRFVLLHRARRTVAGLQNYLRDADRLAAVGTLAAGVAHELSNPLTYVVTNLELLAPQLNKGSETHELANEALRGTERVMGIVRDLRAIARPTRDRISPCNVEACLDAALNITHRDTHAVAKVVRDYGGVPAVWGSDARLGQLFLNLVINATHAMAEGPSTHNELRLTTRQAESGQVLVEIRDTGPGVPKELRNRIFEPFFTTKPVGKGTGLGLFVCHNIISSLDGTIDLQSSPSGTVVTVRLPAVPADIVDTGRARASR